MSRRRFPRLVPRKSPPAAGPLAGLVLAFLLAAGAALPGQPGGAPPAADGGVAAGGRRGDPVPPAASPAAVSPVPQPALPPSAAPAGTAPAGAAAVLFPEEIPRGELLVVLIAYRETGPLARPRPVGRIRAQLLSASGSRVLEVPAVPLGRGGPVRVWLALLGIPSTVAGGDYQLLVDGYPAAEGDPASPLGSAESVGHLGIPARERLFERRSPLRVLPRQFPTERIALDRRLSDLRTRVDPRKEREAQILWQILTTVDRAALHHTGAFQPPLPPGTRRTGTFADRRVYEYTSGGSADSVHFGIDFASSEGTPVAACASGVVVLAGERIVTGNTVIVEHLPGLYSLYYHLSSIAVRAGERVQAGQPVGKVGSTGLATGPHLHWEVRAGSIAVDPDSLTRRRIIDKTAIFGIIKRVMGL